MSDIRLEMSLDVAKALIGLEQAIVKERQLDDSFGRTAQKAKRVSDTWAAGLKHISAEQRPVLEGHRKWEAGLDRIAAATRALLAEESKRAALAGKAGQDSELAVMRQKLALKQAFVQLEQQLAVEARKQHQAFMASHYATQRFLVDERERVQKLREAQFIMAQLPALSRQQAEALRGVKQETLQARDGMTGMMDALTVMAAGGGLVAGLTAQLGKAKQAIMEAKSEAEMAAGRSLSRDESRAKLLQVAEGSTWLLEQQDYKRLTSRSDYLVQRYGLERTEADELLYHARQMDFEQSVESIAAARPATGDVRRVLGIAGALSTNFGIQGQESINMAMVAAAKSPLELEETSEGFARMAGPGRAIGSSPEELMTYLTVLTKRFGNTQLSSDRLAYLVSRIQVEGLGGEGLAGAMRKIHGMTDEERKKLIGERVELTQTLSFLSSPDVQQDLATIGAEIAAARAGSLGPDSALERKKRIAAKDPALSANYAQRRAKAQLEVSQDLIANRENRRRAVLDQAEAELIRRGVSPTQRALLRDTADWVTSWLSGEGAMPAEEAGETKKWAHRWWDLLRNPFGRSRVPPPAGLQQVPAGGDPQMEEQNGLLRDMGRKLGRVAAGIEGGILPR